MAGQNFYMPSMQWSVLCQFSNITQVIIEIRAANCPKLTSYPPIAIPRSGIVVISDRLGVGGRLST